MEKDDNLGCQEIQANKAIDHDEKTVFLKISNMLFSSRLNK
jgi:hypothetical protein